MTEALLDKREARIRNMFGAITPTYDLLNHLLSLNIDRYWRWRTTRLVPPAADGPILDLCTGTGDLVLAYDRAAHGQVPIVGADFCPEMLCRAQSKTENRKATERIRYVEADAQCLPFPDGTFQIACVAFGLRNVTDTDRGIAEMVRVTRPGARWRSWSSRSRGTGCSAGCTASISATYCPASARCCRGARTMPIAICPPASWSSPTARPLPSGSVAMD